MIRKASLFVSAVLLMGSACGREEDSSGISTARSQMKPLVEAACEWMFGCCSSSELVYQVGDFTVDADDCSDRVLEAIASGVPLEIEQDGLSTDSAEGLLVLALSLNEGRVSVDGGAVRACAEATTRRDCNVPLMNSESTGRCIPSAIESEADPCEINEMFQGRQAVGEACDGPWECADGLRCVDLGVAGVCAPLSNKGESCFSDQECQFGLVCGYTEGECVEGANSGQSCQYADPLNPIPGTELIRCASGFSCDPTSQVCVGGSCAAGSPCFDVIDDTDCPESLFCVGNFTTVPVCRAPGAEGAPCSKADDCLTEFCDPALQQCASLLASGENCASPTECQSGFCSGGICNPSYGPGMLCPSFINDECKGGYCDMNPMAPTCQAYVPEGGACPTGFECNPAESIQCVDAMCLSLPFPNGTTCFDSAQCASKACFGGVCTTGAVVGASCRTDNTTEPCIVGSFCEAAAGEVEGVCAALRRSGEPCRESLECAGECIVRYGQLMCDARPAIGEAWCDGPG